MGQGSSTMQVHVQLDQQVAYTGDIVRGSVYVATQEPVQLKGLHVKVVGTETCHWTEGSGKHRRNYSNKKHVMKVKVVLLGNCQLAPGSYQYPISFQLPHGLPGSFAYSAGSDRAAISYKVKAHLDREGMFAKDGKHACPLNVMERSKGVPRPVAVSKEELVSYYCCFNKGMILFEASMPTDTLTPGDNSPVPLTIKVTNNSSVAVMRVHADVVQKLQFKSSSGYSHRTSSTPPNLCQRLQANGTSCVQSCATTAFQSSLMVPHNVEATVNGQVITSTYVLRLKADTGCCLTSPVIEVPLTLNDPQPVMAPMAVPQLPPGWNPSVAPMYTIPMQNPEPGYMMGKPECMAAGNGYQATGVPVQHGGYVPAYVPAPEVPGQVPYGAGGQVPYGMGGQVPYGMGGQWQQPQQGGYVQSGGYQQQGPPQQHY